MFNQPIGQYSTKTLLFSLSLVILGAALPSAATTPQGQITGGKNYTLPGWFKKSFLDFKEDLTRASANTTSPGRKNS